MAGRSAVPGCADTTIGAAAAASGRWSSAPCRRYSHPYVFACSAHRKRVRPAPSAAQIYEKSPLKVKNFGIWFRYDSRTGTHNAYKEIREMSLTAAINMMYMDMAGRSRAKSKAIQILKTAELKPEECKRADVKQFHSQSIRFPLPHRVAKIAKKYRTTFKAARPTTFC